MQILSFPVCPSFKPQFNSTFLLKGIEELLTANNTAILFIPGILVRN